jgi:ornithine cyclodeaminase
MQILIINQAEVNRLLPMRECVDVMARALQTLSRGEALLPLRTIVQLPDGKNAFAVMPAFMQQPQVMGAKAVSIFPGNHGTALDSHQGAVLLFETAHGSVIAVMDASSITAIRTAAVSAVATRALSRPDSSELAILGSAVQARTHIESIPLVRPIKRVRVWSRHAEHARVFAESARRRHPDLSIETFDSAREAVRGAHIVCTVTASREPVLMGDWLDEGTHVNAVGASAKSARELDSRAVARSSFFVDRRESTLNESGDFLLAKRDGLVSDAHILAEVGEVLIGRHPGRRSAGEITLFKSLGLAIEDLAAAHHIYERAARDGLGTRVELGGGRSDIE